MTQRQDRAPKGKEHATESWTIGPARGEEDQRTFEGEVDVTIDWDKINNVVQNCIGRALRSAKEGKSGRITWQGGTITVKFKKGSGKFFGP
jgi:hypothetical protein